MYDLDAIEAINIDQLVTATDRLLLRKGDVRRLESRPSFDLAHDAALAVAASNARAQAAAAEQTVFVRAATWRRDLVGAGAIVAGVAWLSVALACLLA